ncbi:MAG TPA: VUT family protein, partial [Candidatus Aenigmarchaeota archaeon]|nr:VUT family protein [Candidatus Aenigmarchaeota archaeon]
MESNKTNFLLGMFVSSLIGANLLGNKITEIFGIRTSVGVFLFPILFLITDIVEEVHGKEKAKSFVYVALLCQIFIFLMVYLAIIAPPNPAWGNQEAYESVFYASMRIIIASIVAFFISQIHDVWAFQFWKNKTKGKYLWLRNNLSTIASQFIDT